MSNKTAKTHIEGSVLIMVLFIVIIVMLVGTGILYLTFRDILSAKNLMEIISRYYKTVQ